MRVESEGIRPTRAGPESGRSARLGGNTEGRDLAGGERLGRRRETWEEERDLGGGERLGRRRETWEEERDWAGGERLGRRGERLGRRREAWQEERDEWRRASAGRRSCGGCGRCLQVGRRSATSTRRSFGRGNVRFCG
jgi:hypothetical protein